MATGFRQALIGLGANLGDRAATLAAALGEIRRACAVRAIEASALYETEPVGVLNQPKFLNQVIGIETPLTPEALLGELQAIEAKFGRVRDVRWGPRTLDLDLLAVGTERRDSAELVLPHPRMLERAFVVVPLREVLARPLFASADWDALRAQAAVGLPDEADVKVCA